MHFSRGEFSLHVSIRDSGFIGLTGPNGSGKTTFLHILAGVEMPDRGHIKIYDRDVTGLPISERRIVYLNPETYFGHADVDKHLRWGVQGNIYGPSLEEVKESLGISYSGRVSELSLGQRARVILGTAIMAEPDLILIDELFANVSERGRIIDYLENFSTSRRNDVIFVSQDPSDLEKAGSVYRMEKGELFRELD